MNGHDVADAAELPWYHVCSRCNAKWFAEIAKARCPRCRQRCTATEQIKPPWWRSKSSEASHGQRETTEHLGAAEASRGS